MKTKIQFVGVTLALLAVAAIIVGNIEPSPRYNGYRIKCIDGVQYYRKGYAMAVAFNRDSTVKTCEETK